MRPGVSVLSYGAGIADCVNAAYNVWQSPTHDIGATVVSALLGFEACKELVDKVRENRAEALAADHPETLTSDLEKVAEAADASTWESEIADRQAVHDITLDVRWTTPGYWAGPASRPAWKRGATRPVTGVPPGIGQRSRPPVHQSPPGT